MVRAATHVRHNGGDEQGRSLDDPSWQFGGDAGAATRGGGGDLPGAGDGPSARQALRRAIYLAPDSAPAHFMLGSLLLRQREPKRGRRSMETVVSLLAPMPPDAVVPGGDGLTAGRLLEAARAYLESRA